jgi:tetratricopeptide (TPR) repeat protein
MNANTTPPPEIKEGSFFTLELGRIRDSYIFLLIVLIAFVIYGSSITYQYTYSDDTQLLVVNEAFLSNLANVPKLFTTDVFVSITNQQVFYRPFLNFLFMLEMQVSKDSPVIFHITNILLHIGCSLLLFVVFKQLKVSKSLAAMAALFFCAHPLNTSAVVWIPGRNDTLLTLLVLASFSMFLRALDTKRILPLVGHYLLFFLAMLTKESAVALPFLCAAYVFVVRREKLPRNAIVAGVAVYGILFALWFSLRSLVTRSFEIHQSLASIAGDWLRNSPGFILYIGKALLPFNLSIYPNLTDHSLILGWITILVFVVVFFLRRPSSIRGLLWGLAWFFLFLGPTFLSGIILHEHRAYSAFIGLLFASTQLPLVQSIDFSKYGHVLAFVAVIAVFSVLAMVHSEQFSNRTAYATSAYMNDPSVDASNLALAGLFIDEGEFDEADRLIRGAMQRDTTMLVPRRMLGDIYAHRREYALAAQEYETSIRLNPLDLYTYINYGKMCMSAGKNDDAARLWKRSVMINPDFLLGYYYLANFYVHVKNEPDSAMMYAKEIQRRGVAVMPELLHAIQDSLLAEKKNK